MRGLTLKKGLSVFLMNTRIQGFPLAHCTLAMINVASSVSRFNVVTSWCQRLWHNNNNNTLLPHLLFTISAHVLIF